MPVYGTTIYQSCSLLSSMPRTRRTTEELRQHVAASAAADLLQQQQRRGRTPRQAAIDSRTAIASQALALRGVTSSASGGSQADLSVNSSVAEQYRRAAAATSHQQQQISSHHQALQQAVSSLG